MRTLLLTFATLALFTAFLPAADNRCFELRIYTANPGKLDALNARFRDQTLRLFERHKMTNIGYWTPAPNPEGKLYYVLAYPGKPAREESWKAFAADPDWIKAKAASEVNGKLVAKVEQRFLAAADFSPAIKAVSGWENRVFELRTYEATPGNLGYLVETARHHATAIFQKYNIEFLGAWTPLAEEGAGQNTLTYLLAYPSSQALRRVTQQIADDPQMAAIGEELAKRAGGSPVVANGAAAIELRSTDYSPMK